MCDSDCSTFSLTLSNIVSDISNSSVSSFYSSSCSSSSSCPSSSSSSCPSSSSSCSVSSTCPTSSSSCSYSCPSSSSNCSSSSSKSCVKCLSTTCQCKIVQKKYNCLKDKICFNKQCLVVLKFLQTQVTNISELLRCRDPLPDRLDNIKLVEDTCDKLFCVVSNNSYKSIEVTVCKVKSDDVLNYQLYKLKIVSSVNKKLVFEINFVITKNNFNIVTAIAVMRLFNKTFADLLPKIKFLEASNAEVFMN